MISNFHAITFEYYQILFHFWKGICLSLRNISDNLVRDGFRPQLHSVEWLSIVSKEFSLSTSSSSNYCNGRLVQNTYGPFFCPTSKHCERKLIQMLCASDMIGLLVEPWLFKNCSEHGSKFTISQTQLWQFLFCFYLFIYLFIFCT